MLRATAIALVFFLSLPSLLAQTHLVRFRDKAGTPFSVERPEDFLSARAIARRTRQNIPLTERDLPVSPAYVQQLKEAGAKVRYTSRWLNAAIIDADAETLETISTLPFVDAAGQISFQFYPQETAYDNFCAIRTEEESYGAAQKQSEMLGLDAMNEAGYTGAGMRVAIMDAGFGSVTQLSAFSQLRIAGTYDFVNDEENVFDGGSHGQRVLSAMAAYAPDQLVGAAYEAEYFLLTTEDERNESRAEEAYWLVAAEYADSAGVDIILTSLGYSDFDNPIYNYTPADLDGNTALITKAADWAAATGMLVVTSAGNKGNRSWEKLTFPADADSILSVGAVDDSERELSFSSVGFVEEGRVKPDVAALGQGTAVWSTSDQVTFSSGTSFAAPLVAALATGLWQANPEKTNMEIIEAIQRSGSRVYSPNEKVGYGVPHFERATNYIVLGTDEPSLEGIRVYPNPVEGQEVALNFSADYLGQELTLTLFDLQGRVLQKTQYAPLSSQNLRYRLPAERRAAMLLLQVSNREGKAVFRLVTP